MSEIKKKNFTTNLNEDTRIDLEAISLATGSNLNELLEEMIKEKKKDIIKTNYNSDETKFEVLIDIAKTKLIEKKKKRK